MVIVLDAEDVPMLAKACSIALFVDLFLFSFHPCM
jgi:hypothetical protein